jgi:hypothetical protein
MPSREKSMGVRCTVRAVLFDVLRPVKGTQVVHGLDEHPQGEFVVAGLKFGLDRIRRVASRHPRPSGRVNLAHGDPAAAAAHR